MNFVFIYITNPSEEEARKIARHLLDKRLIACVNIFPISSMYWWEGKITEDNEYVMIAKTREDNYSKVEAEVDQIHPYDVPCIVKIPVSANKNYFNWLMDETK